MDFSSRQKARGAIVLEITPLVDVVFLLLIFFLLTATYVKNPNLDINLPKASLNQTTSQKKDIAIAIKTSGEVRFNNQEVSLEKLEGILRAEYAENEDAIVVVQADQDAKHGRVVDVMDLAKKVGFAKLAIAIQASPAEID
ncbi:MAG: biopolymer transporter ExbD [Myxococcota bacterium]|nr:biopolymer transporter ExbD [Myxococcota bacterium]